MAKVYRQTDATTLKLPGRRSSEIVSAATGSHSVTLRRVEVPVPLSGDAPRGFHSHRDCEECIVVESGEGVTVTEKSEYPLQQGDTILIPAGERHFTRNTGNQPLVLLCFFPVADVTRGFEESTFTSHPLKP